MQNLPDPETYEREYEFMPWGTLITELVSEVHKKAPRNGYVVDLMCGTGSLLGRIQDHRPDLRLLGIDLDREYLTFARLKHPHTDFEEADVLCDLTTHLKGRESFDVVMCTAGIHHLPDEKQVDMLRRIRQLTSKTGIAFIADPHIADYDDERGRLLAGAELGYHYLMYTIEHLAPPAVIDAAVGVLRNDVLLVEWKTSFKKQYANLKAIFSHVEVHKTWPDFDSEYGDYYYICRK